MGNELPEELWVVCCPIHVTRVFLSRVSAEYEVTGNTHDEHCRANPDFKVYKVQVTPIETLKYVKPITSSPLQTA